MLDSTLSLSDLNCDFLFQLCHYSIVFNATACAERPWISILFEFLMSDIRNPGQTSKYDTADQAICIFSDDC